MSATEIPHRLPVPNEHPGPDIEHTKVQDDPREWTAGRKRTTLAMVALAALIATLGANIYNPAIQQITDDLHANNAQIALTLSIFIVIQGGAPLFWAALSEVKGRKTVYLVSMALYAVACAICGIANTIELLIGMRVLQALGGAAVISIGAGTLADIFDPKERGTMLGIYYAAPLLGPALGPILGGVLTQIWSWRATFYFLAVFGALFFLAFLFFRDTFRRERSTYYQSAVARIRRQRRKKGASGAGSPHSGALSPSSVQQTLNNRIDMERATEKLERIPSVEDVQLNLTDVNPFPQFWLVIKRKNNIFIIVPSGILFALNYSITYTCSKTLFAAPYNYGALRVGLVLLSFGLGCIAGSILGGRWSDLTLARMRRQNGGYTTPEMRLESTIPCLPVLPLAMLAYGWVANEHLHIATLVVSLFLTGFGALWIYSSTLAYVVDSNVGRSSTAVATNSFARGIAGFIASEVAVPLQLSIGDGGLYTLWAGLCVLLAVFILILKKRGGVWRAEAEEKEARSEST